MGEAEYIRFIMNPVQEMCMLRVTSKGVQDLFVKALYEGHADLLTYFLTLEFDLNCKCSAWDNTSYKTLMWHAIYAYSRYRTVNSMISQLKATQILNVIDYLIEKGADVNDMDRHKLPIVFAMDFQDTKLIEVLLRSPHFFDLDGENGHSSFLMKGISRFIPGAILIAKDPRSNVHEVYSDGMSLIQYAIEHNSEELVKILLDRGAPINHQDHWGCTALHYAITEYSVPIATLLLHYGAATDLPGNCVSYIDGTGRCRKQQTAYEFACSEHDDIAYLMDQRDLPM